MICEFKKTFFIDWKDKKGGLGYIDSASFRTGSEMEIRPSVEGSSIKIVKMFLGVLTF